MIELPPIPSASVSPVTVVKPGFFISIRTAYRRSFMAVLVDGPLTC